MSFADAITQFIVTTRFEEIPSPVIGRAKELVLDCAGVMIAGSMHPAMDIIIELIHEMGGTGQASVVGKGMRTNVSLAAFANSTMAHVLDYDDTSRSMRDGHPTAPVLPAVLALGERGGASGKKIVEAYILGSEVEMKIGSSVIPAHADKGWHTTGTLGSLGAAVAAARILGLDVARTRAALGIAASEAAGIIQNFGTMTKSFHSGAAAQHGIIAALLAKKGFTASIHALEGKAGFYDVLCDGGMDNVARISECLGNPYDLVLPGVDIKRYPCCSSAHGAIEGVLQLAREHDLRPEAVEHIRVGVSYKVPNVLAYRSPETDLEARSSMHFCVAVTFLEGKVTAEQFTDRNLADPRVHDLMRRVEMYIHPDLQTRESLAHEFTSVTMCLRDGTEYSVKIEKGQGSLSAPLEGEEVVQKYRECAQSSLTREGVERSLKMIQDLENLRDIRELMGILSSSKEYVLRKTTGEDESMGNPIQ